ncbi:MAG: flagellar motor switch protein FliN [Desulfobacterales bacterium]
MTDDQIQRLLEAAREEKTAEPPAAPSPAPAGAPQLPPPETNGGSESRNNIDFIMDIPVEVVVELGRTRIAIKELLKLNKGAAVVLSNLEGEPVDIIANKKLIARGEVLVEKERYGIRVTEVVSSSERVRHLMA